MQPNNQYFQPQAPQQPVPMPPQPGQLPPQMPPTMQHAPPTGANGMHDNSKKWVIATVLLVLLLLMSLIFGFWAFAQMQDYKNNVNAKIAVAVTAAEKSTTEENNATFADTLKKDRVTYVGPSSYGTITVEYPETWSGYVDSDDNSNEPLTVQFHPVIVPAVKGGGKNAQAIALTVQVVNESYDNVVEESQQYIEDGSAAAVPFALEKMPNQVGLKVTGKINQDFVGTKVILPLRDKTIVITAETDQFAKDLETYILPYITFVP